MSFWNALRDFILYSEGMLTMENNRVRLISLRPLSDKQPVEPLYQPVPLMHCTHGGRSGYFHREKVESEVPDELNRLKNLDVSAE